MKKMLITAVSVFGLTAGLWASCMGPFCWDDKAAYVNGTVQDGNGSALPPITSATVATTAPTVAGQEVYCSDCTRTHICVSSGTAKGAYIVGVETGTMASPTHCS